MVLSCNTRIRLDPRWFIISGSGRWRLVMPGGGWGWPGVAGGGWGRPEAARNAQQKYVFPQRFSCLDSFLDASMKRAALSQLYSSAKKVVPERFLKNTSNCFFYPKKVTYFDILGWYSSLFHTIVGIIFLKKGILFLYYSAALSHPGVWKLGLEVRNPSRNPPRFLGIRYFFVVFDFTQGKKKRTESFC